MEDNVNWLKAAQSETTIIINFFTLYRYMYMNISYLTILLTSNIHVHVPAFELNGIIKIFINSIYMYLKDTLITARVAQY